MKTLLTLLTLVLLAPAGAAADDGYVAEIDTWHAGRVQRLREPGSWLSLVGLIGLPEGRSSFGTGEGMDLRLDAPGPDHIGDVVVQGTTVRFEAVAPVTVDGEPVSSVELQADVSGNPTVLETGSLSFHTIERHGRFYFRVKDSRAPLYAEFHGIDRWPVDRAWRIEAHWIEYEEPQMRLFPDVLGVAEESPVAGEARFTIGGTEYTLFPNSTGDDWMYFVFGDATNGVESYGAGRFVYTGLPDEDGTLVIDFNRAYNPPCVFTPFATCALPAEGNFLDLEVTAGEKMFGEKH